MKLPLEHYRTTRFGNTHVFCDFVNLRSSDVTPAGTNLLADANPGPAGSVVGNGGFAKSLVL